MQTYCSLLIFRFKSPETFYRPSHLKGVRAWWGRGVQCANDTWDWTSVTNAK